MTIEERKQKCDKGEIRLVTLSNSRGMSVEVSSLGAGIVSVAVPDRAGNLDDVALGYANPADYLYDGPCAGKTPGRYANRIALGKFSIDGKEYQLAVNNGPNALHGGPEGFQNQLWDTELLPNGVRFTYHSKDGEEGYPGNLKAVVEYTLEEEFNRLNVSLYAETDKPTIVNMTNHTYWNLNGEDSGSVLDHEMQMKCSRYLPGSNSLIPTGEMASVADTPMDFTKAHTLGRDIRADFPAINYAKGYDSSWVIDEWQPGKFIDNVVVISSPKSGRVLSIGTDQPAAHVYTGNWLEGSPKSKSGRPYRDYDGVAVEMQGMPDAPNKPEFPSQVLRPDEEYRRHITFTFTAE
ncbi:MAG: galactose mutarotase [Prevotella sp.]|nr:galactose mutarotase [Prevotella sp.]MCM1074576.1 galactose mutarotase [Ruminococcus sp.]